MCDEKEELKAFLGVRPEGPEGESCPFLDQEITGVQVLDVGGSGGPF